MRPQLNVLASAPRVVMDRPMLDLLAPMPGEFVPIVHHGDLVTAGAIVGRLVVLGVTYDLVAARLRGLAVNHVRTNPPRQSL